MVRNRQGAAAWAAPVLVTALLAGLAAGCTATPCKEGDNSRFRCDSTVMAIERLALRQGQTPTR